MLKIKQAGVYRWTLATGVTVANADAQIGDRCLVKLVSRRWAWARVVDAYVGIDTRTRMVQVRCAQRPTGYVARGAQRRAEDALKEARANRRRLKALHDAEFRVTPLVELTLDLLEAERAVATAKTDLKWLLSQARRTGWSEVGHG